MFNFKQIIKSNEFKIFFTLFLTYIIFAKYDGWNENSRIDLTLAIVNDHTLSIDNYHNNTGDKAYSKGHFYSEKAPGSSLIAVPIYWVYSNIFGIVYCNQTPISECNDYKLFLGLVFMLITFTSSLFTALTAVVLYKFLQYFTNNTRTRLLITYVFGLGTISFQYATVFLGHASSTFFIFLAYYLFYRYKEEEKGNLFFVGLAIMFSFLIDYTNIGFLIFLLGYILFYHKHYKIKQIVNFCLGVAIISLLFFCYNYLAFGNPFDFGYRHQFSGELNEEIDLITRHSIERYIYHIKNRKWDVLSIKLSVPLRVLVYPYRGLFFYNPILIFGLINIIYKKNNKFLKNIVIVNLMILLFIYIKYIAYWWGGTAFGPRYLLPVVPFLSLFLVKPGQLKYKLVRTLFYVCIFISILFMLAGNQPWEQQVLDYDGPVDLLNWLYSHEKNYLFKYQSFLPLENPMFSYYLPLLISDGPRSLLGEKIFNIRLFPWSNVVFCLLLFFIVWRKKINLQNF